MMSYNPYDWYWIVGGDGNQVYSSASGVYVPSDDPAHQKWISEGGVPTKIDTNDNLGAVLAQHLARPDDAEPDVLNPYLETLAATLDGQQVLALRDHEERIGGLEQGGGVVAFAATVSATQAIVKNTPTRIAFDTTEFDTTGAFDTVNNRFLPLVEGYYTVNCGCGLVAGSVETYTSIYKNGVEYRRSTTGDSANARLSTLVYLNGSTDYIEGWVRSAANFSTNTSTVLTSFSAALT